jgi:hypothetical protein
MRVLVQVASDGGVVDDSTIQWPAQRPLVEFGTIELNCMVPDGDAASAKSSSTRFPAWMALNHQGTRFWILELRSILLAANAAAQQPCQA